MTTLQTYFFNGQFHACYELAKTQLNTEQAQQFIQLFEKYEYDQIPKYTTKDYLQLVERENETYSAHDEVERIRQIKDEKLFADEINKLEQLATLGTDEQKAASYFTQAQLFLYAHHYDESIHCFIQATKYQPNLAVYYGLAAQTMQRFNWSPFDVMAYLERAIELDPENARWYWNKALVLIQLHKDLQNDAFLESAIIALERAQQVCRENQASLNDAIMNTFEKIKEILIG